MLSSSFSRLTRSILILQICKSFSEGPPTTWLVRRKTKVDDSGAHAQDNLHTLITDHYKEEDINFDLYGRAQR